MKKRAAKKTALSNLNPYLVDPATREALSVIAVSSANRMEGVKVTTKVTREQYRILQEADAQA